MKLLRCLLCCTLIFSSSVLTFAQEKQSLAQLQKETQNAPHWAVHLSYTAILSSFAALDLYLIYRAGKLNQIAEKQAAEIKNLETQLKQATASASQKNPLPPNTKKHTRQIVKQTANKPAPAVHAVPNIDQYIAWAKSPQAKSFVRENQRFIAQLPPAEAHSLIRNIDQALQHPNGRAFLNALAHRTSDIATKQLYIKATRYLKVVAFAAILVSVFDTQEAKAQKQLTRLEENPLLFLEASEEQLAEWEQNPKADALCRQFANLTKQAASLSEEEASSALGIALQQSPNMLRKWHGATSRQLAR